MWTYTDVSDDPAAPARAAANETDVADARNLGYQDLGYVGAVADSGAVLVDRVLKSPDDASLMQLTTTGGQAHAALVTLLADGTVVSTNRRPKGSRIFSALVAHGIVVPPEHRYFIEVAAVRSMSELVERHRARVADKARERDARPIAHDHIDVVCGTRRRYRQIGDLRVKRQEEIAKTSTFVGLIVALAAVASATIAMRTRPLGDLTWLLPVGAIVLAVPLCIGAHVFGMLVLGPTLARRSVPASPPSSADEVIALGKTVRAGKVPAEPPAGAAARADARIEVPLAPAALDRARQRDVLLAAADAALFPALALAVTPFVHDAGPFAAWGLILAIEGLLVFKLRRGRLALAREKLVPDLVLAEASVPGASCPFPSRGMASLNTLMGVAIAAVAIRRAMTVATPPMLPSWWVPALVGMGFLAVALAVSRTRKRHRAMVAVGSAPTGA